MDSAAFEAFKAASQAEYAEDNVLAGRWGVDDALHKARAEFERLAPQGLQTPGHRFLSILAAGDGPVAGHLWLGVSEADGERASGSSRTSGARAMRRAHWSCWTNWRWAWA
jgi:hypothetical protein